MTRRLSIVALCLVLAACASGGHLPPTPVYSIDVHVDDPERIGIRGATVAFGDQAFRLTNENGDTSGLVRRGRYTLRVRADGFLERIIDVDIIANARYGLSLERVIPPMTAIGVEGRFFVNGGGTFRPVFASELAILARPPNERADRLNEVAALGFNGIRVFAGDLGWAGQTPESARANLPALLAEAQARGLYIEVTAITGCGSASYDYEAHLRDVAGMVQAVQNGLLEVANEPYHPTQCAETQDFGRLAKLAQRAVPAGMVYALGAPPYDEPQLRDPANPDSGTYWPMPVGPFVTVHLDRGRPKFEGIRRVRELANVSETTGRAVLNNEPIGAAEEAQPGRRENDPAVFFALGALSRLFEVGSVFHSEDGLNARPLGPVQTECAKAFVAGVRSIITTDRLTFKNASWGDSPVKGFSGALRVYSGITGNDGYSVVVGDAGVSIEWQNGWRQVETLATRDGVRVLRIAR